ncbi:MAG: hypothetical protein KME35_17880 [Aphanocapsa sp. GSE-SYN-MK-11-07L]|nr:hypothetical protein [Aphanocapsa sp. GSE-SYN-MK-11-07L]
MMLIALVSREGKCGKSDHIKELRELTRILRNKANQDSDEEPQNPFSKLHEPELWQLIEAACYINREIATPIPFDLLLHGTPKKKGLLFALTGWIERLEVKGSNWQVVIRDPDYVALIRAFGRGNSLRQIPIIDLETLVSKTHFLKRSPSKGFGR